MCGYVSASFRSIEVFPSKGCPSGTISTSSVSYTHLDVYKRQSGYCAAKKDGIKNNYYLDTLPVKGFLGEAEIANDEELAKAKTAEQFKSCLLYTSL